MCKDDAYDFTTWDDLIEPSIKGNYWDSNHSPQTVFIIEINLHHKASPTGLVTIMTLAGAATVKKPASP